MRGLVDLAEWLTPGSLLAVAGMLVALTAQVVRAARVLSDGARRYATLESTVAVVQRDVSDLKGAIRNGLSEKLQRIQIAVERQQAVCDQRTSAMGRRLDLVEGDVRHHEEDGR